MDRTALSVALTLTMTVLVATSVVAGPSPAPVDDRRITAEEAAAIAVNDLTERGAGYHLRHPDRAVDFTPQGVRVAGLLGAPEWTWSLEAVASASGRALAAVGPVAPMAVERTLIRYDRCVLHEDYRLKQSSVEQLLVIPEPLHLGGDDLVVTGAVVCDGELTEDRHGWAWRGPRGEVTLGRVTVLDADGEVLPARLEVTATSTRLVVDGKALLAAAYPVVVDPEIGTNDYPISYMGPGGDTRYRATLPAVAYNSVDNEYLVVWRGNDGGNGMDMFEYEIFGQVVDASGNQVGYNDVRISYAGGTGSDDAQVLDADVAYNTTRNEYMVVWSADNPEEGCVDEEYEIWGQVLAADLFPLYGRFRVSSNGGTGDPTFDASHPAVTYNPDLDQYLVVWDGDSNTGGLVDNELEIWAQRVGYSGFLVGSDIRTSDMGGSGSASFGGAYPDVTYNGHNHEYLVVWRGDDNVGGLVDNEYEIFGQLLISANGGSTGPNDFRLSDMGGTGNTACFALGPAVAYNSVSNEYLVVWRGSDNVGGLSEWEFEVFGQRVDYNLVAVGANDFRLSDAGGIGNNTYNVTSGPDVTYSPILNQYMVVWGGEDSVDGMVEDEEEVFAQMLTWDGQEIGPNDERISDAGDLGNTECSAGYPVVAANTWNGELLVAWVGDEDEPYFVPGETEIIIQRMDGMALFVDPFESGDTSGWSAAVP